MDTTTAPTGFRHYIRITDAGTRRTCKCGWKGARTDDHPPLSRLDAIATVGPAPRR